MSALVTIAVPSLNQGRYLAQGLDSILGQRVSVEVFVADGGSTDGSQEIIARYADRLAGWRSGPDRGQAAAINEGIRQGSAPYATWLNSDDAYLEGGLAALVRALEEHPDWPMAYGRVWNVDETLARRSRVFTRPFSERLMASVNLISQPGALIRRSVWEAVGGLDEGLQLAMDYDLWWRVYRAFGAPGHIARDVAMNRVHNETKTRTQRKRHYQEAMEVVRRHYGHVPLKWWLAWPVAVWGRSLLARQRS